MKIGGMGGLELVIILVIILLIFGPKNLPKLGNAIGKTVSNLREGMGAGKKKKAEEDAANAEGAGSEGDGQAVKAEIEGEVETVDEPGRAAEPASANDAAGADEADDAPKKVRRVVKKKVVEEEPSETE